ncbi:MAG: tetratricopeptide repeat protein, partial [Elainellaceae cyanobacterium]
MLTLRLLTAFVPLLMISAAIIGSEPMAGFHVPAMAQDTATPAVETDAEARLTEADRLFQQGTQQFQAQQFEQSLLLWQRALALYREPVVRVAFPQESHRGEGYSLGNMGNAYANLGQYQRAIDFYTLALGVFQNLGDRRLEATTLNKLGTAYADLGQSERAIEFHLQALGLARELGNRRQEAMIFNTLGIAYQNLTQYSRAIDAYEQSLNLARELGDRAIEKSALGDLSGVYVALGQYSRAINAYEQALVLARELGDRYAEGCILVNLGHAHQNLEKYEQAIHFYEQSLSLLREVNSCTGEAVVLGGLGIAYQNLGQHDRAIDFHERQLVMVRMTEGRAGESGALGNLGRVYAVSGQPHLALFYYQQALAIAQARGDRSSWLLSAMGQLLAEQGQLELAIVFYKASVNITESIRAEIGGLPQDVQQSFTDKVSDTYYALADLLLRQNRVLEAQQVVDLLKVQELDNYLDDVRGNAINANGIEFWQPEQAILERFNAQQQQAVELGQELAELREIPEGDRTPTQQQRIAELVRLEEQLNRQFNDFIE